MREIAIFVICGHTYQYQHPCLLNHSGFGQTGSKHRPVARSTGWLPPCSRHAPRLFDRRQTAPLAVVRRKKKMIAPKGTDTDKITGLNGPALQKLAPRNCMERGAILISPSVQFKLILRKPNETNNTHNHFRFGIGVLTQMINVETINTITINIVPKTIKLPIGFPENVNLLMFSRESCKGTTVIFDTEILFCCSRTTTRPYMDFPENSYSKAP